MDYTYLLSEISNNQLDILSKMNMLQNGLDVLIFLFGMFFLYIFLRNLFRN